MFGFKKKEKKPLFIKARDVFSIIKSDYDEGVAFCLCDFVYKNRSYTMGSSLIPNSEERKENIFFIFNQDQYDSYDEFAKFAIIDGVKLSESEDVIEITRAGIIDGEEMISTPWGDTRLAKLAIKQA